MDSIRHRCLFGFFSLLLTVFPLQAAELSEAQEYLKSGNLDAAMDTLNELLRADPDDPRLRFTRGLVLVRQGKQERAIQEFKSLAVDYPELPEPYNNLAVLFAAQGDFDAARDALLAAIQTHPTYATAHENLGDIYARMAAAAYDKALSLDKGNRGAQAKLALVNELVTEPGGAVAGASAATTTGTTATTMSSTGPVAADTDHDKGSQVAKAVQAWASSWRQQDVNGYLASYAENFEVPAGLQRGEWERQRRVRLSKPDYIQVDISDMTVGRQPDSQRYLASFQQAYRSNTYQDSTRKQLVLENTTDGWKIVRETSLP